MLKYGPCIVCIRVRVRVVCRQCNFCSRATPRNNLLHKRAPTAQLQAGHFFLPFPFHFHSHRRLRSKKGIETKVRDVLPALECRFFSPPPFSPCSFPNSSPFPIRLLFRALLTTPRPPSLLLNVLNVLRFFSPRMELFHRA